MSHATTNWITLFGSARPQPGEPLYADALHLGRALGSRGWGVCNGGNAGIMEASARGAREVGAPTFGVTLSTFGAGNAYLDRKLSAPTLFERIQVMLDVASAVVILPGGTGTLLELATVLEYSNKRLLGRDLPIVTVGNCWAPVIGAVMPELVANEASPLAGRPRPALLGMLHQARDTNHAVEILDATLAAVRA